MGQAIKKNVNKKLGLIGKNEYLILRLSTQIIYIASNHLEIQG
jgi:hypothetical protein